MQVKDLKISPEKLILETAKTLFFSQGRLKANATEIAQVAGVNRTLINYYYRSVDRLLEVANYEIMEEYGSRNDEVLFLEISFREKIEKIIENFYERLRKYPYSEVYFSFIKNEEKTLRKDFNTSKSAMDEFCRQAVVEMEKGVLKSCDPKQFIANLFSLIVYPFLANRTLKFVLNMDDEEYEKFLNERKEIIISVLFN